MTHQYETWWRIEDLEDNHEKTTSEASDFLSDSFKSAVSNVADQIKDTDVGDTRELAADTPSNFSQTNTNSFDFFSTLPDELVVYIFSFLSLNDLLLRVSLVNHRFKNLSRTPTLWVSIHIPSEKKLSLTGAHELLEQCTVLKNLSMKMRSDSDLLAMFAIEYCPRLERLDLTCCEQPSPIFLESLAEFGHSLRKLSIWGCGIDANSLQRNPKCFQRLTHLDLFNCRGLQDTGLRIISDHCKDLEYLNIDEVTYLTDSAMNYFIDKMKDKIKYLLIDGESLTDVSFSNLGKCHNLEQLSISFADQMRSKGLTSISKLSKLTWLKVRRGKVLEKEDFVLAFSEKKLSQLKTLDLSECSELDDNGLKEIAKNCPKLRDLSLEWCWELMDESIRFLFGNCPALERLQLIGVLKITSYALEDINIQLPHLKMLDLQQCPDIDDDQLQDIVDVAPHLEAVNYYGETLQKKNFKRQTEKLKEEIC